MNVIAQESIFFPPNCRVEHRRASNRIVVLLPVGDSYTDNRRMKSVTYSPDAHDDTVNVNTRTSKISETRATLKAAAWACMWVLEEFHVSDEGFERSQTCIATELSLTPLSEWPSLGEWPTVVLRGLQ